LNIFMRTNVAASTELLSWSTGTVMSGSYRDIEEPESEGRWSSSWSGGQPRSFSWSLSTSQTDAMKALWRQSLDQDRLIGVSLIPALGIERYWAGMSSPD
jgi:hypothetical protein